MNRPRLFVFSPLPPARNGIADYAAELIVALEPHYRCVGVVADDAPDPIVPGAVETMFLSEYRAIAQSVQSERHLFQLGNNAGHAYLLPWLERVSGVVVIHDATLAHVCDWIASAAGADSAFVELAEAAHGREGRELLAEAHAHGLWWGGMGQELTFLAPAIQPARAVIVHSRLARQRVLVADHTAAVHVIPHFTTAAPRAGTTERPAGSPPRLLCLGFPSRAKRLDLVLQALQLLRDQGLPAELTIAGEIRRDEVDIESEIASLGLEGAVELTGYVDAERIDQLLHSADLLVNLRDPTSGESSGTLSRALAAGCCTIVTDVGTYSEFPDGTVFKLGKASMTGQGLAQAIWQLCHDPELREQIARRGREHAESTARLELVAYRYAQAIETAYATAARETCPESTVHRFPAAAAARVEAQARACAATESKFQLWWRERMLPLAPRAGMRLLVHGDGAALHGALASGWGWGIATGSDAPEGALILCDECEPHGVREALHALGELAERLPPGRSLTVEVANQTYLRGTVMELLSRHGVRPVAETFGPRVPLFGRSEQCWLPYGWVACFARDAARMLPIVSGRTSRC